MDQTEHILAALESGALIIGVVEILKEFVPYKVRDKVAPLLAILLGGVFYVYLIGYSEENVLTGLMYGLASTGAYKFVNERFL